MAASQATTPTSNAKTHVFTGKLNSFYLGEEIPTRRWMTVETTYGEARRFFRPEPYDPSTNRGEQRHKIDSHVKKLKKVMLRGEYTPAPWSVSVLDGHKKNLEVDDKNNRVTLKVTEGNPLPLIDANHRRLAKEAIRLDWMADKDKKSIIDSLPITVIIYLDPEFRRDDFRHLQEGLNVSKSQLQTMEAADGARDPKKAPFINLVYKAAMALNAFDMTPEFYLKDEIKFIGGDNGRIEFSSIKAPGGSDMATTLYGGAKIVLTERFKPLLPDADTARKFLVDCQTSVWRAIWEYGTKEEVTNQATGDTTKVPTLLLTDRMLRPTRMKGTRGGTMLLIMLGNMLAYRMLAIKKSVNIETKDLKALIRAVEETLDMEVQDGNSGPAKRKATGEFVREYFEDVTRKGEEDQHDKHKVDAVDGVPFELTTILTRSTLNVEQDAQEYNSPYEGDGESSKKGRKKNPPVDRTGQRDTDPAWTEDEPSSDDNSTSTAILPDFEEGPEEEEFTPPPPGRNAKPASVTQKNRDILSGSMG